MIVLSAKEKTMENTIKIEKFVVLTSYGEVCKKSIKNVYFLFPANSTNVLEMFKLELMMNQKHKIMKYKGRKIMGYETNCSYRTIEQIMDDMEIDENAHFVHAFKGLETPLKMYQDLIEDLDGWDKFFETI